MGTLFNTKSHARHRPARPTASLVRGTTHAGASAGAKSNRSTYSSTAWRGGTGDAVAGGAYLGPEEGMGYRMEIASSGTGTPSEELKEGAVYVDREVRIDSRRIV